MDIGSITEMDRVEEVFTIIVKIRITRSAYRDRKCGLLPDMRYPPPTHTPVKNSRGDMTRNNEGANHDNLNGGLVR